MIAHAPPAYTPFTMPHRQLAHFTGFVLRDGRRAGFSWDEKPRCIGGHRLKTKDPQTVRTLTRDAIVTCVHQEQRGAEPCNIRQYVALMSFGGSARLRIDGDRVWLSVEVTDAHVRTMHAGPMLFLETLSLLQCVLPGVDLDLPSVDDDQES